MILLEARNLVADRRGCQIQVVRYALKILSKIERETDLVPETQFDYWSNWGHLYRPLIAASQVSDARDLVIASIEAEGALNTWRIMFQMDIHAPHAFNRLLGDWNMEHYDESTYLAILDILVSVICDLCSFSVTLPEREHLTTAERCLQHAHSVAICLKENSPELMKSRPYIRWVLAKSELERKLKSGEMNLQSHLSAFPGLVIWKNTLPIYIPIKSENPLWRPELGEHEQTPTSPAELLEAAVGTTCELGDYATEIACLTELVFCSSGSLDVLRERFDRMRDLQLNSQGNILDCQRTCLTRYLTTTSVQARRDLVAEIRELKGFRTGDYSLSEWCTLVIEDALCFSLGDILDKSPALLDEGFSIYLPQYIKDQIIYRGLEKTYNLHLNHDKVNSSSTHWSDVRSFSPEPLSAYARQPPSAVRRPSYERVRHRDPGPDIAETGGENSTNASLSEDDRTDTSVIGVSPPDRRSFSPPRRVPTRRSTVESISDSP